MIELFLDKKWNINIFKIFFYMELLILFISKTQNINCTLQDFEALLVHKKSSLCNTSLLKYLAKKSKECLAQHIRLN